MEIKVNDISTKLMTLNESNPSLVVSRMNELKNKIDTILDNITLPKTYLKMMTPSRKSLFRPYHLKHNLIYLLLLYRAFP